MAMVSEGVWYLWANGMLSLTGLLIASGMERTKVTFLHCDMYSIQKIRVVIRMIRAMMALKVSRSHLCWEHWVLMNRNQKPPKLTDQVRMAG